MPMHSKEDYTRSRAIHKKLNEYSDFIYDSFSSDSESEDEDSQDNSDQDSPPRHPFDMPNREWKHWQPEPVHRRTGSPELASASRTHGLVFDSVSKELTPLLESQMNDTMVLGSLLD